MTDTINSVNVLDLIAERDRYKILYEAADKREKKMEHEFIGKVADAVTLQARVQSIRTDTLEEAANKCSQLEITYWEEWKKNGSSHTEGTSDGCSECRDAIRALKTKE